MRGRFLIVFLIAMITVLWPLASAAPAADTAPGAGVFLPGRPAAAVGALFTVNDGRLGTHFCTASVVDSPAGDLLITAAHCMSRYSASAPAGVAFVPGYDNGAAPYGTWKVTRVFVDPAWAASASANDDVAFLTVARSGSGQAIESVTGGEALSAGPDPAGAVVRVTGYPDSASQPVSCQNQVTAFGARQLEFDCDGYTDGTSGSPFLVRAAGAAGPDLVIGVIGGYQQGGDSPDVSYAAAFGPAITALYQSAAAEG